LDLISFNLLSIDGILDPFYDHRRLIVIFVDVLEQIFGTIDGYQCFGVDVPIELLT
jgi:hypothetical protein